EKRRLLGRVVEAAREMERLDKELQKAGGGTSRQEVLETQKGRAQAEIELESLPGGDPERLKQAQKEHAELSRQFSDLEKSIRATGRGASNGTIQMVSLHALGVEMRQAETPTKLRELYGQARQHLTALERVTQEEARAGGMSQRARDENTF